MDGGVGIEMVVLLKTESLLPPPHVSALVPAHVIEQDELSGSIAPPFEKLLPQ